MGLWVKKNTSTWMPINTGKLWVKKNTSTWKQVSKAFVKITSSQWAQFWPILGITPRIEDAAHNLLTQIDGTVNTKLYGYIGGTVANKYYFTWQWAPATSKVPPDFYTATWYTETGTGKGGTSSDYVTQTSTQETNGTKQYIYYTTDSSDIGNFIRLKIITGGSIYYSGAVLVTYGVIPTPTISTIVGTSTGFYFDITNYSTYTAGKYSGASITITDTAGNPLMDASSNPITYSISSNGRVTVTYPTTTPGNTTISGKINVSLYPYEDAPAVLFSGTSLSAANVIAHSYYTSGTLSDVYLDFTAVPNAAIYSVYSDDPQNMGNVTSTTNQIIVSGTKGHTSLYKVIAWADTVNGTKLIDYPYISYTANGQDAPLAPTNIVASSTGTSTYGISWNKGGGGTTNEILYISGSQVKNSSAATDNYSGSTSSTSISYSFDAINSWTTSGGLSGSYTAQNVASGTITVNQLAVPGSVNIYQATVTKGQIVTASVGLTSGSGTPDYYQIQFYDGAGTKIADSGQITSNSYSYTVPSNYAYSTITAWGTAWTAGTTPPAFIKSGYNNPATVVTPSTINVATTLTDYALQLADISWPPVSGALSYVVTGSSDGTHYIAAGANPLTDEITSSTHTVQFRVLAYSGANHTGNVVGDSGFITINLAAPVFSFTPAFTFTPVFTFTPSNTAPSGGSVSVTGTLKVNSTLTANVTNASGSPTPNYTYKWYSGSDGYATVVDTGSTHLCTPDDQGYSVKVVVTFTNVAGSQTAQAVTGIIQAAPAVFSFTPVFSFVPVFSFTPHAVFSFTPTPPIFSFTPRFIV